MNGAESSLLAMMIETFVVFLVLLWMMAHTLHKRIDDMNRRIEEVPKNLDWRFDHLDKRMADPAKNLDWRSKA